jgi:hypothetical protein
LLVEHRAWPLSQHPCQRRDENVRWSWLLDEFSIGAVTLQLAVTAVDHKRDVPLLENAADLGRVLAFQPVIEDRRRKIGVACMNASCRQSMGQEHTRAGPFEKFLDMKGNERLVFDDKNQTPVKLARHNAPQ